MLKTAYRIPEQRAVTVPSPLWWELMLFLFSDSGLVAWHDGTQRTWEIWRTAKIAKEVDSPAVSEFLIDSTCLSKSQEVVDTERSALAMETGQSERWLWFYGLRAAWFRLRDPACVSQGEGRDSSGVWDGHVHSAIFRMGSQQGPTVCYVPVWMGGEFGGEWIHVHVWLSPFSVHLKLSWHSLVTGYIPI